MPRASSVEPCLLCGQMPCACGKPAKPKAATSRKRASSLSEPTEVVREEPVVKRQSMTDRMRARAAQAPAPPRPVEAPVRAKPTAKSAELPELAPDELIELAAIRLLDNAFGVEGDAVTRYRPYLEKPPSLAERRAAWRGRRTDGQAGEAPPNA
jgi:hypothetical protein